MFTCPKKFVTDCSGLTGLHAYDEVLSQIHKHVPKSKQYPLIDLVPSQGVKITL